MATVPGCPYDFPETHAAGGALVSIVGPPTYPTWIAEYTVPAKEPKAEVEQDERARVAAEWDAMEARVKAEVAAEIDELVARPKKKRKRRTKEEMAEVRQAVQERLGRIAADATPDWLKADEDETWQQIQMARPRTE